MTETQLLELLSEKRQRPGARLRDTYIIFNQPFECSMIDNNGREDHVYQDGDMAELVGYRRDEENGRWLFHAVLFMDGEDGIVMPEYIKGLAFKMPEPDAHGDIYMPGSFTVAPCFADIKAKFDRIVNEANKLTNE